MRRFQHKPAVYSVVDGKSETFFKSEHNPNARDDAFAFASARNSCRVWVDYGHGRIDVTSAFFAKRTPAKVQTEQLESYC